MTENGVRPPGSWPVLPETTACEHSARRAHKWCWKGVLVDSPVVSGTRQAYVRDVGVSLWGSHKRAESKRRLS